MTHNLSASFEIPLVYIQFKHLKVMVVLIFFMKQNAQLDELQCLRFKCIYISQRDLLKGKNNSPFC